MSILVIWIAHLYLVTHTLQLMCTSIGVHLPYRSPFLADGSFSSLNYLLLPWVALPQRDHIRLTSFCSVLFCFCWSLPAGRVDNVYGDRNLVCTLPPADDEADAKRTAAMG